MYKNYTVDANFITSTLFLANNYPSLVLPFLEVLEECISIYYKQEIENITPIEDRCDELCIKFVKALDECSADFGDDDFIHVTRSMYYKLRSIPVDKPNQVINFLKPILSQSMII